MAPLQRIYSSTCRYCLATVSRHERRQLSQFPRRSLSTASRPLSFKPQSFATRSQSTFTAIRTHLPPKIPSQRRALASAPAATPTELTDQEYHRLSDRFIAAFLHVTEELAETDPDYDVEYSAGVLTISVEGKGTYVLNKQPPNKQIWLSSPISGPKRFDLDQDSGDWVYAREKRSLKSLLEEELGVQIDEMGH
jgi:frataxin